MNAPRRILSRPATSRDLADPDALSRTWGRPRLLVLLAVLARVRGAGFDLAVHAGEWRGRFGAFLLVLVLLRLLLFPVAADLTFRHGDLWTLDERFDR